MSLSIVSTKPFTNLPDCQTLVASFTTGADLEAAPTATLRSPLGVLSAIRSAEGKITLTLQEKFYALMGVSVSWTGTDLTKKLNFTVDAATTDLQASGGATIGLCWSTDASTPVNTDLDGATVYVTLHLLTRPV
ncbi:MAG: hypothetical protein E6R03_17600 [Hyphomicrobiaceae bacterium]|nr:MAG: hypothetical protein E6R03_17600 [Hyphomicrobiaceae bacterium]